MTRIQRTDDRGRNEAPPGIRKGKGIARSSFSPVMETLLLQTTRSVSKVEAVDREKESRPTPWRSHRACKSLIKSQIHPVRGAGHRNGAPRGADLKTHLGEAPPPSHGSRSARNRAHRKSSPPWSIAPKPKPFQRATWNARRRLPACSTSKRRLRAGAPNRTRFFPKRPRLSPPELRPPKVGRRSTRRQKVLNQYGFARGQPARQSSSEPAASSIRRNR